MLSINANRYYRTQTGDGVSNYNGSGFGHGINHNHNSDICGNYATFITSMYWTLMLNGYYNNSPREYWVMKYGDIAVELLIEKAHQ